MGAKSAKNFSYVEGSSALKIDMIDTKPCRPHARIVSLECHAFRRSEQAEAPMPSYEPPSYRDDLKASFQSLGLDEFLYSAKQGTLAGRRFETAFSKSSIMLLSICFIACLALVLL